MPRTRKQPPLAHQKAARIGKQLAEAAIERRDASTRARNAAVTRTLAKAAGAKKRRAAAGTAAALRLPARSISLFGRRPSAGLLIAEGDSWFDYPFNDVRTMLEDRHGYDVVSVANAGDRVEDMAYSGDQLDELIRVIEKALGDGKIPRAVLLSGGGNDIAGDEFQMLLDHAGSPTGGLNKAVVDGVIEQRIANSYVAIINAVTAIAQEYLGRPLPILTHGYGHPVPDGRGVLGGAGPLPGPWLRPGFWQKGFEVQADNTLTMEKLIDQFNAMVKRISDGFGHVHYVDVRPVLRNDASWKQDWANELHPKKSGFARVADRFAEMLAKV